MWKCQSLSCVYLFMTPVDCSSPGSSVRGILQARILEWVAISFSRGSSQPRDQTWVSRLAGWFFTSWEALWDESESHSVISNSAMLWTLQSMEFSRPEYPRGSSWPRNWTAVSCIEGRFFPTEPSGKPCGILGLKFKGSAELCSIWRLQERAQSLPFSTSRNCLHSFVTTLGPPG